MSSGEENSLQSPTMEFIEEPKPNIQHPLTTPLPSTTPSNSPASPPQTLFTSNSPPPSPPPQPPAQPPSALPPPTSTSAPQPSAPHPPSASTSATFTSPPPRPPRSLNKLDDDQYFNSFPPGYRFCPQDHELVMHYLTNKVKGLPLPRNRIVDVTLYQHDPEFLADKYNHYGEKEWYFFTPRDKKYRNGTRPNRAAGNGYWKATGADKQVTYNKAVVGADRSVAVEKVLVGYRKALVHYHGKAPKGNKTNWIMHEYRVNDKPQARNRRDHDMRLDDWVLCRIYKKHEKRSTNAHTTNSLRNRQRNEEISSASLYDIEENHVSHHQDDHDSSDLADNAGEIHDMISAGSSENVSPTLDELSQQQSFLSGFSDITDYYPAPLNLSSSRMFHDAQITNLYESLLGPAPMFQEELLNPSNYIADPFLDRYPAGKPSNLPGNPAPFVNFRPTNAAPPAHRGRLYMNTAPPTGIIPPTNTAPLTCRLPPMNTGCLPPTNHAVVTSRIAPINPANSQPMSAVNVEAKLPKQPPQQQ